MPGIISPASPIERIAVLTASLIHTAATYDLGTVSGGAIEIADICWYNDVAAIGLVSVVAQTNDTTPTVVLATVLLNALTGGLPLTSYAGPLYLPSAKKLQYTIVGTGTAGTLIAVVRYRPLAAGAVIA